MTERLEIEMASFKQDRVRPTGQERTAEMQERRDRDTVEHMTPMFMSHAASEMTSLQNESDS